MKIFRTLVIICALANASWAQRSLAIDDPEVERLIKENITHLYNTEVAESQRLNRQIRQLLPNHPVNPLLEALTIRAAHHPLEPESPEMVQLKSYLYQTVERAEDLLDQYEEDPEANFFAMVGYGLLSLYENESGNYMKAVGRAKEAYSYLKSGMDMKDEFVEFYFSTGLYNYYREKYPEMHPVYKPFVWFFRSGDLQLGLQQLDKAFRASIFMRPEAASFLTHIYLHYENEPQKALPYAQVMVRDYPQNLSFIVGFLEASLAAGSYERLEKYVQQLLANPNKYFQLTGHLFEGMLLEKKHEAWQKAEQAYTKALAASTGLSSDEALNYRSYAFAGMARVAAHEYKHEAAEQLYKKALAEARYPVIKQEAQAFLE